MARDRCQPDLAHRARTACCQQWQDAELAMTLAPRCVDDWSQAGREQAPRSLANGHADRTQETLHKAARAVAVLIKTFGVEARAWASTPGRSPVVTARG